MVSKASKIILIVIASVIVLLILAFVFTSAKYRDRELARQIDERIQNTSDEKEEEQVDVVPVEKPERIVLSLNFNESNMPISLIPLGEKVTHDIKTNPDGHVGIDFQWDKKAPIYAFLEGTVVAIANSDGHSESKIWDVGVKTGEYLNSYTELEDYNRNLTVGSKIEKGTFIGYPWHPTGTHAGYRMIHWNFGYWTQGGNNIYPDRLCPLTYFDNESLAEINQIWKNSKPDYKSQYPLICNGVFENKNG